MKWSDIRTRVMVAALLPVLMVGILLSVAFLVGRSGDLNESYQQRARALARQLASSSEYGIFSANEAQLQSIGLGASKEPDVRSVDIFDSKGILLTRVGTPLLKSPEMGLQTHPMRWIFWFSPCMAARSIWMMSLKCRHKRCRSRPNFWGMWSWS
jgi:uncharacterized membrane protein affecting hemolysin expression